MLSEISQPQKDIYYMSYLYEVSGVVKFIERKQNRGYQELGKGNGNQCLINTDFQYRMIKEEVLDMDIGDGGTTMSTYLMTLYI